MSDERKGIFSRDPSKPARSGILTVTNVTGDFNTGKYDVERNVENLLAKSLTRGTKPLRDAMNRLGGQVRDKSYAFRDAVASLKEAMSIPLPSELESEEAKKVIKNRSSIINKQMSDFLTAMQNSLVFAVSNEKGSEKLYKVINAQRNIIKELATFTGTQNDPARKKLLGSRTTALPSKIKEAIKQGEDLSEFNFQEIILSEDLGPDPAPYIDIAVEEVKKEFDNFINPSVGVPEKLFGLPGSMFAADKLPDVGRLIDLGKDNKKRTTLFSCLTQSGGSRYVVIEIGIDLTAAVDTENNSTISMNLFKPIETGNFASTPEELSLDIKTTEVTDNNFLPPIPTGFLQRAKALTPSNRILFDWEHIIGLVTENIVDAIEIANGLIKFDPEGIYPVTAKTKKILAVLKRILSVSHKVDSLFNNYAGLDGRITEPLTTRHIIELLNHSKIDITEFNWVMIENDVARITHQGPTKRINLTIEGGEIEFSPVDNVVGIWGDKESNTAKGVISGILSKIALKAITGDLNEAENEIKFYEFVEDIVVTPRSDSFIKTAILMAIEEGLGTKISQVPGKKIITKGTAGKRTTIHSPKLVKSAQYLPANRVSNSKPKTAKSTVYNTKTFIPLKGSPESNGVLGFLNANISDEVKSLMKPPRLNNNTGRFANSVQVLKANSRKILVSYMTNPYDIFSKDRGKAPWNYSGSRDPVDLISLAIRNLLSKASIKYANSVSIGRG